MKRVYATAPATRGWDQFVSYTPDEVRPPAPLTVYAPLSDIYDTGLLDHEGEKILCRRSLDIGFLKDEFE